MNALRHGTVVAAVGRHYDIELTDGEITTGYPRGKKSELSCGDMVSLSADGQITAIEPRHTLLYRSDAYRQKLLAANVDQLILVVATTPSFNDALLSRALVAAESQRMRSLIVLNKTDLVELLPQARASLLPFATLGYPIIELAAKHNAGELLSHLAGRTSIFVGQSGMGKSTITNALIPDALASTREISTALDSGKHTTTCARLYHVGTTGQGRLIDIIVGFVDPNAPDVIAEPINPKLAAAAKERLPLSQ